MLRLALLFLALHTDLAPAAAGSEVRASWLGTAGVYLTDGDAAFVIDPFVSRKTLFTVVFGRVLEPDPRIVQRWIDKLHMPKGTPVLVSHSHFDHVLDAPTFATLLEGRLVGSASTLAVGKASGLPENRRERIAPGGSTQVGSFRITALGSCHEPTAFGIVIYGGEIDESLKLPASASAYRVGDTYTYVVEHPQGTVVHHASPCTVPGMFKGVKANVVFLGIAGRANTKKILEEVVDAVGAKVVVAIHYDNFFESLDLPLAQLPGSDVEEFLETARKERPQVKFLTLPIGEPTGVLP